MNNDKIRTITLTDRPPVTIREAEWPVIATAHDTHSCGQYSQNGEFTRSLRVRRHSDGRTLVYCTTQGDCQCSYCDVRGGVVVDAEETSAAIQMMADTLRDAYDEYDDVDLALRRLARECIADLPAEEL